MLVMGCQSVLENKYDHVSAIYHLLVDRCKKHQAAIVAGQTSPPLQPVTSSNVSPTHLPITAQFSSERRRSSITTGIGLSLCLSVSLVSNTVFRLLVSSVVLSCHFYLHNTNV